MTIDWTTVVNHLITELTKPEVLAAIATALVAGLHMKQPCYMNKDQ